MATNKGLETQVLICLRYLASVCDGAHEQDGVGFNGGDSNFGKSLAAQRYLSDKQLTAAVRMLKKYHGQLQTAGVELPSVPSNDPEKPEAPVSSPPERIFKPISASIPDRPPVSPRPTFAHSALVETSRPSLVAVATQPQMSAVDMLPQHTGKAEIELSDEQETLFRVMEGTKQHLFITGRAGAGKSVLLRHFRENTQKRVVVAAPTGIAALNVRGQTLHSLFKLPPTLYQKGKLFPNQRLDSLLKRIDCLVIDEISMVRADIIDAIDDRFRKAFDSNVAFGGVQVIMFGDVYQLPPVVEEGLTEYFETTYGGHYFFNANTWKQTEFKIYELTQVFRQKDPVFKNILNAVRDGSVQDVQIGQLNSRYGAPPASDDMVTLAPTNALVTEINQRRLDQLEGTSRLYNALITGEMKKSAFPTEENLQLKPEAQIVMLKNDMNGRWVNGTVGHVAELFDDHIDVRVNGIVYSLERETWEEVAYSYDAATQKVEQKVQSSFTQYPLRLAWALTIHKSQGQTYEFVQLDLTTSAFAHGQMYVALSRCTSLEGLTLKVPVKRKDIIVDAKVTAFMSKCETITVDGEPEKKNDSELLESLVLPLPEFEELIKEVTSQETIAQPEPAPGDAPSIEPEIQPVPEQVIEVMPEPEETVNMVHSLGFPLPTIVNKGGRGAREEKVLVSLKVSVRNREKMQALKKEMPDFDQSALVDQLLKVYFAHNEL